MGAVHEYTARLDGNGYDTGDAHPHVGGSRTPSPRSTTRKSEAAARLAMLNEEYAKPTENPRTVFYRAQYLREDGDYAEPGCWSCRARRWAASRL